MLAEQPRTAQDQIDTEQNEQDWESEIAERRECHLKERAEDDEQDQPDLHHTYARLFLPQIVTIRAHNINAQTHEQNDQRPKIRPGFPMAGKVLDERHQSNTADDRARDGKARHLFAAREHGDKEQRTDSDDEEGPYQTPVKPVEDLACQR